MEDKPISEYLFIKPYITIPKCLENHIRLFIHDDDTLCLHFYSTYNPNNINDCINSKYQFKIYIKYHCVKCYYTGKRSIKGVTLDFDSNDNYTKGKFRRFRRVNKNVLSDYEAGKRISEFLWLTQGALKTIID